MSIYIVSQWVSLSGCGFPKGVATALSAALQLSSNTRTLLVSAVT